MKSGQVTIFIILGLIISVFFVLYIFVAKEPEVQQPANIATVNVYISNCLQDTAKEGIYYISLHAGYYNVSEPKYREIPYYNNGIPQLSEIENQLSRYIEDNLQKCLDFREFNGIETGTPSVITTFARDETLITLNYPVRVTTDKMTGLDMFSAKVPIDFSQKYELIKKVVEEQMKDVNYLPLSYISFLSYKNDFKYELTYFDNSVVFSYIFNYTKPLVFNYVFRYNWTSKKKEDFIIKPLPDLNITNDDLITLYAKTNRENVSFYDYSDLFDIDKKTGLIEFSAYRLYNKKETALIKAVDDNGNEAFAYMQISINKPNTLPVLQLTDQKAYAGKEFFYKVNGTDPSNTFLFFLDDTSLFDINVLNGEIRFAPESAGNYTIKITAANMIGHSYGYLRLEII